MLDHPVKIARCCALTDTVASRPAVRDLLQTLEYGPAPESPAVAEAWLEDHGRSLGHFIGNQWVKPEGRKTYDTYNPATGQRLASTLQGRRKKKVVGIDGCCTECQG